MFSPALLLLLVCTLLVGLSRCAFVPTDCNQQLFNYYTAIGLVNGTLIPALTLSTGTFMGMNFSTMVLGFQVAARDYQSVINASLVNTTWVNFISVDIPWCTSLISLQCCERTATPTSKTGNCSTIVDFDLGGNSPIAGRLFIYPNQTAACNGTPILTFWNTTLVAQFDATYTYDATGILNHVQLSYTQARTVYRRSKCAFTDGAPVDLISTGQNQFVCTAQVMGCEGTRTGGNPTLAIIPVPTYACLGNLTPNGTTKMVFRVNSMQEPSGVDGLFGQACSGTLNSAEYFAAVAAAQASSYILEPSTRRQFVCNDPDFIQYLLLYYNGQVTSFLPSYPLSTDPIIRVIPCVCDFSMDCVNGTVDTTSDASAFIVLNNAPPIPDPGVAVELSVVTTVIQLNATASYDPDNIPKPLTVYWKVFSTPYDPAPPPFTITNPTAFTYAINATGLQSGLYQFILYVSDGQNVVYAVWNATILANVVTAVVENDKIVKFNLYTGTTSIATNCILNFPPVPCITVNCSLSFGTDPLAPLYFQWLQIGGFSLQYLCDPNGFLATRNFANTTQAIGCFVPPFFGLFTFQCCVTDNITSNCVNFKVQVVPNFQQPNSTFTPILNFTDPPIRNLTQPSRPILNFTPITRPPLLPQAPVAGPPPSNITVPPLFPVLPPATFSDQMALLFVTSAMFLLYFIVVVGWLLYRPRTYYRYLDRTSYGPAS